MANNDQASLQRSHSKSSNAKLTLLCLLATISLNGAVVFIAFMIKNFLDPTIAYIGGGVCLAITALCLFLFSAFKR